MSLFTVKRKNNHDSFFTRIADRKSEWAKVNKLAGRISVPPELQWWYWQEFGTATRGDPGRSSGTTYSIKPVEASVLKFPWHGDTFYREQILAHPGIPSHHFVTKSLHDILLIAAINLEHSFREKGYWSADAVRESLLRKTLPDAIDRITLEMEKELPGVREDGKLKGATASQMFREKAFVRNVGD